MKKLVRCAFLLTVSFVLSGNAEARGKAAGQQCHTHRSCGSGVCVRQHPEDKFGVCCAPQDCAELGRQCGVGTDNCGLPLDCQQCGFGFDCEDFQCVPTTTTTTLPPVCGCVGGTPEDEADCGIAGDPPTDTTNGGCNSDPDVFGTIECGETICGTVGTTGTGYRDTDWYQLVLDVPTNVVMTLTSEFDSQAGILNNCSGGPPVCGGICTNWFMTPPSTPCEESSDSNRTLAPGTWTIFVAPSFSEDVPCGSSYTLSVSCPDAATTTTLPD